MQFLFRAIIIFSITFLLSLFPALAQQGPNEKEPNDTMEDATPITGFTIEGMVGSRGDEEDWFLLKGQEGTYPTFTLKYNAEICDIDLEVYNDGELIGSLTGTEGEEKESFYIPGECHIHVYAYEGYGEYTIEIEPGERDDKMCEGEDEEEPNDLKELADLIGNLQIEAYACENDHDWFLINAEQGNNPTISLSYNPEECDIDLKVYSDDIIVGSFESTEGEETGSVYIPGECYLHVYAYDGYGKYSIEIHPGSRNNEECEGPDEIEPNDMKELANSIEGFEINGYACQGDNDWFVLEGQEGTLPLITLKYDFSKCDIDLDVYSDDELVGSLTATESPDQAEFHVPGTCYIHLYVYEGEGEYTIEIEE